MHNALVSRKFLPVGQVNINGFLPPALGPSTRGASFLSSHPAYQPGIAFASTAQAVGNWYNDQYVHPETRAAYTAYTLWKHSKFGPCDYLDLVADGVTQSAAFFPCDPELLPGEPTLSGATYARLCGVSAIRLRDREPGNLTVLVPGNRLRWTHMRALCPLNPADTNGLLDINAFGFRCIQATPNGFSIRVERLAMEPDPSALRDRIRYRLTIVDPSQSLTGWNTGPASYAWTFTEFDGTANAATGQVVEYAAIIDQPFTLSVTRTRTPPGEPPIVATLTLRERGTDLDRSGPQGPGRALVFDAVSPGGNRDFAPASRTVACRQATVFTARAAGLPPLTRRWHRNGQPLFDGPTLWGSVISGAASDTLSISNAAPPDEGQYLLVVGNALGTAAGPSASLSVTGCGCSAADIATEGNPDPLAGPDGFLTGSDFDLFVLAFFSELRRPNGALVADLTDDAGTGAADGFITGSDFDRFIVLFFAGC